MEMMVDIGTLIVQTPDVREGRPRVAGTSVTALRIAQWYKRGHSTRESAFW